MSVERLALRTMRALCLTGEAVMLYLHDRVPHGQIDLTLCTQCVDSAEFIAQAVLRTEDGGTGTAVETVLKNLMIDIDWLAQVDRAALHRATHVSVPDDESLTALRTDVDAMLTRLATRH